MNSHQMVALHNLEVSEAEILKLRNKGLHGVSEQEARRLADRIAYVRRAAKIADWLFDGTVQEIKSYDPRSGAIRVLMKGGHLETFQL